MSTKKLNKQNQIKELKSFILDTQDNICPLCKLDLLTIEPKNICLDHDHDTGLVRGVLCRNCNSMEGKITNCIRRAKRSNTKEEWFENLILYWNVSLDVMHPLHKTPEQKKELRKKRAKRKLKRNRH